MDPALIPLDACTIERCGGKAAGLAQLLAAKLPVPPGVCLPFSVYREALPEQLPAAETALSQVPSACGALLSHLDRWQPDAQLAAQLSAAMELFGCSLAVRSSASCEDLEGHSAAGVFESVLDVKDLDQLLAAIRRCWTSLWRIPSWATLRSRDRWPGQERMAVILQRQLPASRGGMALSRAPDAAEELLVESVMGHPAVLAQGDVNPLRLRLSRTGPLDGDAGNDPLAQQLRARVLSSESALGRPVEVEWICDNQGELWLLQARAQTMPALRTPEHAAAGADDGSVGIDRDTCWRWDAEHNPEPLSPAHSSLIAHLSGELTGTVELMVRDGYLYEAVTPPTEPRPGQPLEQERGVSAELAHLTTLVDRAATAQPSDLVQRLDHALSTFVAFYRLYLDGLGRARRAARERLRAFVRQQLPASTDAESICAALARGESHDSWGRSQLIHEAGHRADADTELRDWLAAADSAAGGPLPSALRTLIERYGAMAPTWDLASATLAERPSLLKGLIQAARDEADSPSARVAGAGRAADELLAQLSAPLGNPAREQLAALVAAARRARESSEDDDLIFARALFMIRAALLAIAEHHVHAGSLPGQELIFGLPLDEIRESLLPQGDAPTLALRGQQGLDRWQAQRSRVPPLSIEGGHCNWSAPPEGRVARGIGTGGVATGRARVIRRPEQLFEEDLGQAVAICPTLTPALAAVLPQLAALVTDYGGLLSHAACLARELGLPAVIGTGSATQLFRDGDLVWVDGTRGLAVQLNDCRGGGKNG